MRQGLRFRSPWSWCLCSHCRFVNLSAPTCVKGYLIAAIGSDMFSISPGMQHTLTYLAKLNRSFLSSGTGFPVNMTYIFTESSENNIHILRYRLSDGHELRALRSVRRVESRSKSASSRTCGGTLPRDRARHRSRTSRGGHTVSKLNTDDKVICGWACARVLRFGAAPVGRSYPMIARREECARPSRRSYPMIARREECARRYGVRVRQQSRSRPRVSYRRCKATYFEARLHTDDQVELSDAYGVTEALMVSSFPVTVTLRLALIDKIQRPRAKGQGPRIEGQGPSVVVISAS